MGAAVGLRVRLAGSANNPYAVGALIRIQYSDSLGPAREVHAGSGYWSADGLVQVMGLRDTAIGVWVRWPGGEETETLFEPDEVAPGRQVTVRGAGN